MLDWLSNIGKKADHPMYNVEAARKLLADLPEDNGKALEDISANLETVTATPGFSPGDRIGVIKLLDETGQKREAAVLSDFLRNAKLKDFDRLHRWQSLLEFWERVFAAYRLCLQELAKGTRPGGAPHPERTLLAVRALRAVTNKAKVLHLRYLPVAPALWQALGELYSQSEREGFTTESLKAYATDAYPASAGQEFLRMLMMEAALPDSERMLEVELSSRIVARLASGFAIHRKPETECNLCFDLAQPARPIRYSPDIPATDTLRYIGAGRGGTAAQELIRKLSAQPDEPETRFGNDFSVLEKLLVLKRLLLYWSDPPPHRRGPRVKIDARVNISHGFAAASELVTRIEFSGMAEMTADQRLKIKEQAGITLQASEVTAVVTEWVERDGSTWGMGVDIPRRDEPWATVGTLCVFQAPGRKSWWVGAIRRMYRDQQDRAHAGIEILSKKPVSVHLRGLGEGAQRADNWQTSSGSFRFTYVNALILDDAAESATRHELLVPRDLFIAGLQYEAMMGEPAPHLRLEELLERGEDFDRVRVIWLKPAA